MTGRIEAMNAAERRIAGALLLLRLTLGGFLMQWGIEKFVNPTMAAGIAEHFYGISLSATLAYGHGAVEVIVAAALLLGLYRRPTYALAALGHGISVVASYRQLLAPYTDINHLFAASVPVLGAFIALYLLRDCDRYSLDAWRGRGGNNV
ncbi:MAG: DoxX family membrane protein [Proteobacteria bacterium]|nr:DoxX family membrane protein [Pseudomonadota bacterium]